MLVLCMMGISLARLLISVHKQAERLDILEYRVEQFIADSLHRVATSATPSPVYSYQRTETSQPRHNNRNTSGQAARLTSPKPASGFSRPYENFHAETPAEPSYQRKFSEPHLFDLNTIDSITLIRIPGIAARTAHVILKQRERYGGFYNPWQIGEFLTWDAAQQHLDEWCTRWFFTDQNLLRPLRVNHDSEAELRRHPYLTRQQARLIIDYRTRHQRITTPAELQQFTDLSASQMQHLLPYLSFEQ